MTGLTIDPDWTVATGLPVVIVDGLTTNEAPLTPEDPGTFWLEYCTLPDWTLPPTVSNLGIDADVP